MLPPVTEHVSIHGKSLCKNMARASGGANNMHPLNWGGSTNGKDAQILLKRILEHDCNKLS